MSKRNVGVVHRLAAAMLVAAVAVLAGRPVMAQVTFDWAIVGNPGNAPDTLVMTKGSAADYTTGYGSVGYIYQISKYDVTNTQYTQFLNAADPSGSNTTKLYDARMSTANLGLAYTGGINFNVAAASGSKYSVKAGQENFPATWIRWDSGARMVNWLANGQGSGSTESGVYDMSVLTSGFATPPTRAPGATFFLPSENEYYKAAYYDPTKSGTGGYWQYGVMSDIAPVGVAPPGGSKSANIGNGNNGGGSTADTMATTGAAFSASVNYLTNVGAYATAKSYYGLYDTEGLVYNWTEATRTTFGNELPIYRGGSWRYGDQSDGAAYRNIYSGAAVASYAWYGLRIASLPAAPPGTTVNVASGTQTQAQAGYALFSGTAPLTKTGAGTLVVNAANTITGATTVQQGTLQLANAAALASSKVIPVAGGTVSLAPYLQTTVGGLAPNAGGLVDLGNGLVTVASGLSAADLVTAIQAGRGDGSWTGTSGITSSVAATDVASSIPRAVGWLDNGDGSVTAAFAAPGDTNIDWQVDILDAGNFLTLGKYDTGLPATWLEGDFNYDGVVDIQDAADFFGTGLYDTGNYNTPLGASGIAAVPEPSALSLAALAGAMLLWRRREHHA
jgi:autotransporter-associated beta strand protein